MCDDYTSGRGGGGGGGSGSRGRGRGGSRGGYDSRGGGSYYSRGRERGGSVKYGDGNEQKSAPQPVERVYVILYNDHVVYIPIKVNKKGKFLAGMPNFFGGGVDKGEDHNDTLKREVCEESINIINIEKALIETKQYVSDGADQYGTYTFFRLKYTIEDSIFTDEGNFSTYFFTKMKKKLEMQALVKMPTAFLLSLGATPSALTSAHPTPPTITTPDEPPPPPPAASSSSDSPPPSAPTTTPDNALAEGIVGVMFEIIKKRFSSMGIVGEWEQSSTKKAFVNFVSFLLQEQQKKG